MPNSTSNGLDILFAEISLPNIASLIERTARWVSPDTFRLLPLWFPEYARRMPFYKGRWSEPQMNRNRSTGISVHKAEGNRYANEALTLALGLRKRQRPFWSCCHIWGVDDPYYQKSNSVVLDHKFFSCIGNMVLLPAPLKAFTDSMRDIKSMLCICARNLYGWQCDHPDVREFNAELDNWTDWSSYPGSWPKYPCEKVPLGVVPLTSEIRTSAERRKARIRDDLDRAGDCYPRDKVREALAYWKITL